VPREPATPVPDLVCRDFTAQRPNQLWVADITHVRTMVALFYLAMVLDVFSRRIVGWMMSDSLRTQLVLAALEMAVHRRDTGPFAVHAADQAAVIHHSDYAEVLR
jgi:putative transposase